jgi:hypothetical protein
MQEKRRRLVDDLSDEGDLATLAQLRGHAVGVIISQLHDSSLVEANAWLCAVAMRLLEELAHVMTWPEIDYITAFARAAATNDHHRLSDRPIAELHVVIRRVARRALIIGRAMRDAPTANALPA